MKFLQDSSGDIKPYIVATLNIVIVTIFIILFAITISMASTARAFWWNDDPLEKLESNYNDAVSSLITSELKVRQDQRRLFNDHCDLIEFKITKGDSVNDDRYVAPCRAGDQKLYYEVRSGK